MSKIKRVVARQVYDSRGNPTIEAEVFSNNLSASAICPSGASTGTFEAYEKRDKSNKKYLGKKLYLGGIKIPFHSGLQGHSDGDVIIHAIIDGLLGAMRKKDIGTLYPSNNKKFKNIRSPNMLSPILKNLYKEGYFVNNVDINLICEKPKVSKYRKKVVTSLSNLLNLNEDQINLKGKTVEKLGLIGKEKAIACEAIVSLNYYA